MAIPYLTSQISNLKSQHYAIIVAGGSGTRMGGDVPKQFLLLKDRPVLMHAIEAFHYSTSQPQIIVVLHPGYHTHWSDLCREYDFSVPHQLVGGGETRFHSVKNGLEAVPNDTDALIAVHDAARPLTSTTIIDEAYQHARVHGNAVTAVKSRDSVRQVKNEVSFSLLRDEIYLVQTPQTFQCAQLKKAYLQPYSDKFTDDASVVEQTGFPIHIVEGSYRNIKITFPEDIAIAELLLGVDGR
ncbi:MAG TPA: 2-C-methyl-D-erythritol 4-phosphate cytidylyltransferase [Mucilaginibacter sp.]|jgi:2-C-methyl-D-erythritol 4-phosphate cytidylyltransferase|nr:2-C-methyl-D-erythritol 4-phosphate cytidylyltransferase [Mucilaginibacter sp.]